MKTTMIKGYNVSALSLGTVQLGLSYGINNAGGKPSVETAHAILNCAMENGINTLDTAAAYGDSEEVIGGWLKTKDPAEHPFVVTKVPSKLDHSSFEALYNSMKAYVESSKVRLGMDQLPLLLLHTGDDYFCDKENIVKAFDKLKADGDIKLAGISVYSHHNYAEVAESGLDAVQIPLNIFDWTQIDNGGLKKLHDAGMMVFVRSVYLQGLVFKKPEDIEPHMDFCREPLRKYIALCEKYNLGPAELAISYASSLKEVTSLVLGCENVEQVKSNIDLFGRTVQLTDAQLKEIHDTFEGIDRRVIDPNYWKKPQ